MYMEKQTFVSIDYERIEPFKACLSRYHWHIENVCPSEGWCDVSTYRYLVLSSDHQSQAN